MRCYVSLNIYTFFALLEYEYLAYFVKAAFAEAYLCLSQFLTGINLSMKFMEIESNCS